MSPKAPGPLRCPACGQKALPNESRCQYCNARLHEAPPVEMPARDAIALAPSIPLQAADGKCPGCGQEMPAGSVLCIACGYDVRIGRKRETVHADTEEEPVAVARRRKRRGRQEPLPAGLAKVRRGLGYHYARLVLTLLAGLMVMGLISYGVAFKVQADDAGLIIGRAVTVGTVLLAAVLGILGSFLCLWVGRPSRAWGFIFASLVLDVLTPPLVLALQFLAIPPLLGWPLQLISWLLFMLFLRRLAVYVDRPGEANEVMAFITWGIALFVGVPLLLILLGQMAFLSAFFSSKAAAAFLLIISMLILLAQVVLLIRLIFSILANLQILRAAIADRLPGEEPQTVEPSPSGP